MISRKERPRARGIKEIDFIQQHPYEVKKKKKSRKTFSVPRIQE